ncbi:MAG: aquaporin [bacterium]|nr:aquaporin [bacterium]
MSNTKALLAEALGAFVLLFGGAMAILASGGNVVALSFGFGLALLAGLYAFGEVSGGHYNPAVSLGAFLDKRIDSTTLISYVGAQAVGSVVAGLALLAVWGQDDVGATATVVGDGISVGGAYLVEIVLTAVFVAVILRVTKSDEYGRGALVIIPLTLVMIHLAAATVSGASVNPTRSLGSALVGNNWSDTIVWLTAPLVGAAVGWVLYRAVHEGE